MSPKVGCLVSHERERLKSTPTIFNEENMKKRLERDSGELGTLMCDVKQVAAACNIGISTVWNLVKEDPTFPKPIYLSPRVVRWTNAEIIAWVKARAAARNENALEAA